MRVSADRRCVALKSLDPRFRGDDGLGEARWNSRSVVPATAGTQGFIEVWLRSLRIALHRSRIRRDATAMQRSPRSRSHAFSHMTLKSLDPRFRGDDDLGEVRRNHQTVVPAKTGTQGFTEVRLRSPRIALYRHAPNARPWRPAQLNHHALILAAQRRRHRRRDRFAGARRRRQGDGGADRAGQWAGQATARRARRSRSRSRYGSRCRRRAGGRRSRPAATRGAAGVSHARAPRASRPGAGSQRCQSGVSSCAASGAACSWVR